MPSILERREGESELDFHRRLLFARLVDRSTDISYANLSRYLYGKRYAEDVARRMAYGSLRTLKLMDAEAASKPNKDALDALDEIERQQVELAKERQRFYDQRREYRKLHNLDARTEHLFDVLEVAANRMTETVGNVFTERITPEFVGNAPSKEEHNEAVLVLSDWHYGMTCDHVYNTYNIDTCINRVCEVVNQATDRIRLHSVKKLHVVVLGDLIHGAIHASARVASEELVCEQIMQVSEVLAQAIEQLAEVVPVIDVHITYGNHARAVQDKKDNLHPDNMERLVPWWLEHRLAKMTGIRVMPETGTEFLFVDVCGHEFVASHGDLDSVKTSPRLLATLFHKQYGKDIEYVIIGDKHHRESFNELGVTALICGALCGTDDYANEHRLYSTPEQLLLIVNKRYGVDAEYHLKCK